MEHLMKHNAKMYESAGKAAAKIIMHLTGNDRQDMLNDLRERLMELCKLEEQLKFSKENSERILSEIEGQEQTPESTDTMLKEFKDKVARGCVFDPSANENLKEFDRVVKALIEHASLQERGAVGDGELTMVSDSIVVIDPITKKRMTDPVRNTICGHVYERESVAEMLKVNSNTRCPVPGCKYKDNLNMKNMRSDIVTKTYLDSQSA